MQFVSHELLAIAIIGIMFLSGCTEPNVTNPDGNSNNNKEVNDYLLIYKKNCEPSVDLEEDEIASEYEATNFIWVIAELTDNRSSILKENPCVIYLLTPQEARATYENLSEDMQKIARKIIKQLNLNKTIDNDDLPEEPPDLIDNHQTYVTPNDSAVQDIANSISGTREAYREGVSWVWVSDKTLNNRVEKWLKPHEFLTNTPNYPTNPVPGRIASDCEEQANALASLIRAEGIPPDKVRVVLGKVDFDGSIGGHAWVEIYEDNVWFALEATSGPYWDDEKQKLINSNGLSYSYYKFFDYPSIEIWSYYNDYYYYDPSTGKGNPPDLWLE